MAFFGITGKEFCKSCYETLLTGAQQDSHRMKRMHTNGWRKHSHDAHRCDATGSTAMTLTAAMLVRGAFWAAL